MQISTFAEQFGDQHAVTVVRRRIAAQAIQHRVRLLDAALRESHLGESHHRVAAVFAALGDQCVQQGAARRECAMRSAQC
ncbi:hypothetical protein DLE60_21035 [Micromonospora globispora]|uniref:Uncharacterized protein n=1 Tax=Micromonospora globispora TaxID=1450148 RepID=A0A317K3B2_9ACTN|nr:hypothetical protein [Micromonospora globispora]PWU46352.1 hypothetical protein DLJ46_18520 [Micromonospora globispora]PWU58564.1 hypothetical protein DLE60_21035 [Micromonospora globispora]RQW87761.1 hypothetical protein DKL51_25715 [Micromonospora globispora]